MRANLPCVDRVSVTALSGDGRTGREVTARRRAAFRSPHPTPPVLLDWSRKIPGGPGPAPVGTPDGHLATPAEFRVSGFELESEDPGGPGAGAGRHT